MNFLKVQSILQINRSVIFRDIVSADDSVEGVDFEIQGNLPKEVRGG